MNNILKSVLATVKKLHLLTVANVTKVADALVGLLPASLQQAAKALVAAVVPLVGVSLATGAFDWKGILSAVAGLVVTYIVPNRPAPKKA
jgi:hypothetical protein